MLIRSSKNGGNDELVQTRNQLLTETDGFEGNNGVIILTATNRPSPSTHRCRVRDALTAAGVGQICFDLRLPDYMSDLTVLIKSPVMCPA